MRKFISSKSVFEVALVSLLALFVAVSVVMATTTIGSNISTDGTLTVSSTGYIYASSTALFSGPSTFYNTVTLSAANLFVSSGYGLDSAGVLNIGTSTATAINVGKAGVATRFIGSLNASSTALFTGASTFYNTVTLSGANLLLPPSYSLDLSGTGILNIGTSTATTINIGSTGATTVIRGNLTIPGSYSLDAAGILNIGTTTATAITIGKSGITTNFPGLATITNASSTLANFGDGTTVSSLLYGSCTVNFGTSITNNLATTTNCVATGVTTSHKVFMTPVSLEPNLVFNSASSTQTGIIQVQIYNSTSSAVTTSEKTWYWMAIK